MRRYPNWDKPSQKQGIKIHTEVFGLYTSVADLPTPIDRALRTLCFKRHSAWNTICMDVFSEVTLDISSRLFTFGTILYTTQYHYIVLLWNIAPFFVFWTLAVELLFCGICCPFDHINYHLGKWMFILCNILHMQFHLIYHMQFHLILVIYFRLLCKMCLFTMENISDEMPREMWSFMEQFALSYNWKCNLDHPLTENNS